MKNLRRRLLPLLGALVLLCSVLTVTAFAADDPTDATGTKMIECPDCGKKISVFGESHIDDVAAEYGLSVLGRIPIQPSIAAKVDAGEVEYVEGNWLDEAAAKIQQ